MATESQVKTFISDGVAVMELLRTNGGTAGTNEIGLMKTFITDVGAAQGTYASGQLAGMIGVRNAYAASMDASGWLSSALAEYALAINIPERDPVIVLRRLYQYYFDNTLRVKSRNFTFGAVSMLQLNGNANVGDGTVNRLTTDENGFVIENTWAQTLKLQCTRDRNSGATIQEEIFLIEAGARNRDNIIIAGSGNSNSNIQAISARSTQVFGFQNPSFSLMNGAGAVKFDGWTITGTAADCTQDLTNYYRTFYGDTTPAAMKCASDVTIAQTFALNNSQFDGSTPVYVHVAVNKSVYGCTTGTITLTFGDQTASVAVSSLAAGWNLLKLGVSQKNWYKQFMGTAPTLSVAISGGNNPILFDDFTVGYFQQFDGLWYAVVGGATPFIVNDAATFIDTEVGSKIQAWIWRAFGLYLPSSLSVTAITWPDP